MKKFTFSFSLCMKLVMEGCGAWKVEHGDGPMKAVAVFPKERAVRVIDHEEPSLGSPTEVKVRMREVGVCGTDREIVSFNYGTPPPGSDYLIIGHESLGEVVEIGPKVSRVKKGDLVVLTVRRPCPHASCVACREGRPDFCYTGDYTGRYGVEDFEKPLLHRPPGGIKAVISLGQRGDQAGSQARAQASESGRA
jgi:threonine dehydrogenase-like Zn-dependent dehydrogenase